MSALPKVDMRGAPGDLLGPIADIVDVCRTSEKKLLNTAEDCASRYH